MGNSKQYKRTIAGSVGAGIGAIVNGSGRTYYIIEHKTQTPLHKIGESQKIIVDQIELGRDSNCQIRFDESCATVSRRHAAIVRENNGWKIIALSQTNGTYVNNVPVQGERLLNSGDEIKLSSNGPVMGFIVPQGAQSLVKSIGMTERMNLFRQQALRPYKTAITALGVVLVLAVGGSLGYTIWKDMQHEAVFEEQSAALQSQGESIAAQAESISQQGKKQDQLAQQMEMQKAELESQFDAEMKKQQSFVDSLNIQYAIEDSILKAKQAALEQASQASNDERAKLQAEVKKAQNSAYAANKKALAAQKALSSANSIIDSLTAQYATLISQLAITDSINKAKQEELQSATANNKAKIESEIEKSKKDALETKKEVQTIQMMLNVLKNDLANKDALLKEKDEMLKSLQEKQKQIEEAAAAETEDDEEDGNFENMLDTAKIKQILVPPAL